MIDLQKDPGFADYRSPNEHSPKDVQEHLQHMQKGLIVSTGTQRSFFDLLLSPESKCTGLIVRDICPKVKAYVDFVVLLMRISKSREDFVRLSKNPLEHLTEMQSRLEKDTEIPEEIKHYYLSHLEKFAKLYAEVDPHWPKCTDEVNYHENDKLFDKLQRYAKEGRIIATVGDIRDLRDFKEEKIAVVDTSNICDYVPIAMQGGDQLQDALIVYTYIQGTHDQFSTQYHSFKWTPVRNPETVDRVVGLIDLLSRAYRLPGYIRRSGLQSFDLTLPTGINQTIDALPYESENLIDDLEKAKESNLLFLTTGECFVKDAIFCGKKLFGSKEHPFAKQFLERKPVLTAEQLNQLAQDSILLEDVLKFPSLYVLFAQAENFRSFLEDPDKKFQQEKIMDYLDCRYSAHILPNAKDISPEDGEQFKHNFGKERWQALVAKVDE